MPLTACGLEVHARIEAGLDDSAPCVAAQFKVVKGAKPTWASGSYDNTLQAGETLNPGLVSRIGQRLRVDHARRRESGRVWLRRGDAGQQYRRTSRGRLVDQQDGNQVIYVGGTALWASKSSGSPLIFGQWPGTAGSAAAAV